MSFENTSPNWQSEGVEPPADLKQQGFVAGYKPPAAYFNWLLTRLSACITELQNVVGDTDTLPNGINKSTIVAALNNLLSKINYTGQVVDEMSGQIYQNTGYAAALTTTDKSSLVAAINELVIEISDINNYIGDTNDLSTTDKSNIVVALNELVTKLNNVIGKNGTGTNAEIFNNYINNTAAGNFSHAQNYNATSSGLYSHAGGYYGWAKGIASIAHGYQVAAENYQAVFGRYNTVVDAPTGLTDTTGSLFIVGSGTSNLRANALRISANGKCYGSQAFAGSGADYAEYFEWFDGNPDNEDRRGLFVTLDGEKIRIANANDDYILGVVSATPVVYGDVQSEAWKDVFLTDVYGERLTEIVEVPESVDEETGQTIPTHTETRFIINPDYDPTREYVSRENRKEWSAIGLVGKLVVIDDGTCQSNGYCKIGNNGTATNSTEKTDYKVLSRLDDNHIKILLK